MGAARSAVCVYSAEVGGGSAGFVVAARCRRCASYAASVRCAGCEARARSRDASRSTSHVVSTSSKSSPRRRPAAVVSASMSSRELISTSGFDSRPFSRSASQSSSTGVAATRLPHCCSRSATAGGLISSHGQRGGDSGGAVVEDTLTEGAGADGTGTSSVPSTRSKSSMVADGGGCGGDSSGVGGWCDGDEAHLESGEASRDEDGTYLNGEADGSGSSIPLPGRVVPPAKKAAKCLWPVAKWAWRCSDRDACVRACALRRLRAREIRFTPRQAGARAGRVPAFFLLD